MPVKGRQAPVEVDSRKLAGTLTASTPHDIDQTRFDLVALAMQEPQYGAPGVRQLMSRIALGKVPCMSIMNMPPLPYLARLPGISAEGLKGCFTDAAVWEDFDPALMTLCSPDPQAVRPADEPANVLQVRLPSNFKATRFVSDAHTALLRRLEADIDAARFVLSDGERIELPVKLKVHDSVFVPLAKWAMLVAGNYRCVQAGAMRPIRDAVHGDIAQSRAIYEWVVDLCVSQGADASDMVPFDKYAAAAQSLVAPSSAARALASGATDIERVDLVVQTVAAQVGRQSPVLDEIVTLVDGWIAKNRAPAQAMAG
jgi:hypothetical protein